MNTTINYSGFIDLVRKPVSEKSTSADQNEDSEQGPVVELTVKQGSIPSCTKQRYPIRTDDGINMGVRQQGNDDD